jgi:polysaccharide deacetylase family protein (PEP-CTERM system associated)
MPLWPCEMTAEPRTLLLSVDFEDWHQLMRRRVGVDDWERPGPALARQTERLLDLLDQLGVRATFFVLGLAARSHPGLVERIAARGHEIGCHGDMHRPVSGQSRQEFASDVRSARRTIEGVTGRPPAGYRAPAFSITRESAWAYEVLAEEGFAYDASQHDSPRIRRRVVPSRPEPHPLELPTGTMWEFPVAVWRAGGARLPVGGASYWTVMPTQVILKGLGEAGPMAGLYLHPYELDPEPLRPDLAAAAPAGQQTRAHLRAAQRNTARRRAPAVLRAIAGRYRLIPYGEAHAQLSRRTAASP